MTRDMKSAAVSVADTAGLPILKKNWKYLDETGSIIMDVLNIVQIKNANLRNFFTGSISSAFVSTLQLQVFKVSSAKEIQCTSL